MKCPKCDMFEIEVEDDRADTDRGVYGSVYYYCQYCGDVTEEVENQKNIEMDKWMEEHFEK